MEPSRRHSLWPEESDTQPGCASNVRPSWRARPPLQSTTYSILPEARTRRVSAPPASAVRSTPPASGDPADTALAPRGEVLSVTLRQAIDAMHASLPTLSHYELLGVTCDVELSELRRAREALVSAFHPSRFARTLMGRYGRMLEDIRARVEEAYATLSAPDRRAAYDARLSER